MYSTPEEHGRGSRHILDPKGTDLAAGELKARGGNGTAGNRAAQVSESWLD